MDSPPGRRRPPAGGDEPGRDRCVRLLEHDPELGLRVPADEVVRARRTLLAPALALARGVWDVPRGDGAAALGFLVLDGLLARDVTLAGCVSAELVGRGDVLQPGEPAGAEQLVGCHVAWHVLSPVTLAVLDERLARALTAWPQVTAALLERAIQRTLRMSVHRALLQLTPVETRLLVLFWHLAERWGRVTRAGIALPLRLTHETLGQLVGCRRASVTTALKEIGASGLATRRVDGTWLLHGPPPDELSQLRWHRRRPAPADAQPGRADAQLGRVPGFGRPARP